MVNLRPNRLVAPKRALGVAAIVVVLVIAVVGAWVGTRSDFQLDRLAKAGDETSDVGEKVFHYSQALDIKPDDAALRLKRARLLFFEGEAKYALFDLRSALESGASKEDAEALIQELESRGMATEAWQARRLVEYGVG